MILVDGEWKEGSGTEFLSKNSATGEKLWQGKEASEADIDAAVKAARESFPLWSALPVEKRVDHLRLFEAQLQKHREVFAELISKENGKPLWESKQEVSTMMQKVENSLAAYKERCPNKQISLEGASLQLHHKPHGVLAVFGPFNFPGHLPNGHIIPALLAGNTVIFKGSEYTPAVSEQMIHFWESLPKGVINLVHGGAIPGNFLASHPQIDGILFTGSYTTGRRLMEAVHFRPEIILALEMGGNNPLLFSDAVDVEAAAYLTIQSAFLSSGQRCTCARRLIVPDNAAGDAFLQVLVSLTQKIRVGPYTAQPEPFMGPVISDKSAGEVLKAQAKLAALGGRTLLEMRPQKEGPSFLTPGIMDVTEIAKREDEEIFGPFLQVIRVSSFEEALREANHTNYGLCAALISKSEERFFQFYREVRAGVINWNTPTTGASGKVPFGGVKKSGNHRPSGYYAADYCSYPVTTLANEEICLAKQLPPGIKNDD